MTTQPTLICPLEVKFPPPASRPVAEIMKVRFCRRIIRLTSGVTFFGGMVVLLGWAMKLNYLIAPLPGGTTTKANTALAFVLSALALSFSRLKKGEIIGPRWLIRVCAGGTMLLGLLTCVQYLTGTNLGIDELFFQDFVIGPNGVFPGRMAPLTAVAFSFLGIALMTLDVKWRGYEIAQFPALLTLLIGTIGFLGYIYEAPSLYRYGNYVAMALPTTLLFIFLGVGTLVARPDAGLVGLLTGRQRGSVLAKRFLPWALALPLGLDWLRLIGQHAKLFDIQFGMAIFASFSVILYGLLIFAGAHTLNRLDAKHAEATADSQRKDTDLQLGAQELLESARRFRFLADTVPEIIWTARADGTLDYYNQRWFDYTGFTAQETIERGWKAVLHPEDRRRCSQHWTNAVRTGASVDIEFRFKRASDQSYRWHLVRALPMHDADGKIEQWVGTCTDIDDQKKTERELRESQEQFQVVLENISEGLVICEVNGKVLYWNRAGLEMHGMTSLEEGRKSLSEFDKTFELRSEDGEILPLEAWPLARIFRGEKVRQEEHYLRRKDRDWERIFSFSGAIVERSAGQPLAFVIVSDITVRKKAEADLLEINERLEQKVTERTVELTKTSRQLQAVFDASSSASIIACDAHGKIQVFNRGAENMLGYRSEEMIGQSPTIFHLEAEMLARGEELTKRFERPITGFEIISERARHGDNEEWEWTYQRKDGTTLTVAVVVTASYSVQGEIIGFLSVGLDISIRKNILKQLQQAKEAAEAANHSKSRFLANMSHEIRTPMNGVIGMTHLLLDSPLMDDQRDYAETIRLSGENLLTVINDILDFSKIEAGQMTIETLDFDVEDIVGGTLDLLAETAQTKGIEITSFIDPAVPSRLQGDPGRLRQILTNLLGNAIKFTSQGEVDLRVEIQHETENQATLRFQIRDTGIGMSPQTIGKLFRPFSQADISTTRKYGGTGLGLAISQQLVETMGGEIGLDSVLHEGSTFWFSLRFEKQSSKNLSRNLHFPLPKVRILVVDDNETSGKNFLAQLQVWNFSAVLVRNGSDALDCLQTALEQQRPFYLALIDQEMPVMDGLALARLIKENPALAATCLILLSSRTRRIKPSLLSDAGIQHCCLKPVRQSVLLDCLMNALGTPTQSPQVIRPAAPLPSKPRLERILMAEDNLINKKLAVAQLHQLGYQVDVVSNGREALQALRTIPYKIILMDCHMPEMDGYETTAAIRELEGEENHTWIVAMTANAMLGDRENCLAKGMDDYISKPVRSHELQAVLDRALRKTLPPSEVSHCRGEYLENLRLKNENLLQDLIQIFRQESPSMLAELGSAIARSDARAIAMTSHSLKGSATAFGAQHLRQLCENMERAARAVDLSSMDEIFPCIAAEIQNVLTTLSSESILV